MKILHAAKKHRATAIIALTLLCFAVLILIMLFSGSLIISKSVNSSTVDASADLSAQSKLGLLRDGKIVAAYLRFGTDFHIDENAAYESDVQMISTQLKTLASYGVNTVIVPLYHNNFPIFTTDGDKTNDYLTAIIQRASEYDIEVYPVFSAVLDGENIATNEGVSSSIKRLDSLISSYDLDGLLIDDYYFLSNPSAYSTYLSASSFADFSSYKRAATKQLLGKISDKLKNGGIYCGLLCDAVYMTSSNDEKSVESDGKTIAAYDEGFCATAELLQKNLFDFTLINSNYAIGSKTADFSAVVNWWENKLKNTDCDICFMLSNSKVGGEYSADELIKQLQVLREYRFAGYCFDSSYLLINDKTGCTENTVKYINEQLSADSTFSELTLTAPMKNTINTTESSISFAGSCDVNYPLYINNKALSVDGNGYFSAKYSLKLGKNEFTLAHKGKTQTYIVNYAVELIKHIYPSKDISVEGGSEITFGAVGRKNAELTLSLGEQTVKMNEYDNSSDSNSQYVQYYCSMTLPEAKSKAYSIGEISVKAKYLGISETKTAGKISINKVRNTTIATVISSGSQKLLDITNVVTTGNRTIAQVVVDQAEMLKGNVTDDRSRPIYSFLPKGTLDYCGSKDILNYEYDDEVVTYRQLASGCRVYTTADHIGKVINIIKGTLPKTNTVVASSCETVDRHTVMSFDIGWKAPFLMQLNPQSYKSPDTPTPNYSVSSTTYTYLDITFYYAASAQGKFDLSSNPVFKGMSWIRQGNNYVLRLYLRKTGTIYGYSGSFTTDGKLELKFLNPSAVEKANNDYGYSLKGKVIMLDAGHGGEDHGAVGSSKTNTEAVLNLKLAKAVKSELEKTGATVHLTRTADLSVDLVERTAMLRQIMPDVFISIHRDSSSDTTQHGFDSYYYYPFSKKLASSVYNGATSVLAARKVNYYPFFVTRVTECPSILTENGFVSNPSELANLANNDYNAKQAKAFTKGIVTYFASIK